jgi:hypothetical protein
MRDSLSRYVKEQMWRREEAQIREGDFRDDSPLSLSRVANTDLSVLPQSTREYMRLVDEVRSYVAVLPGDLSTVFTSAEFKRLMESEELRLLCARDEVDAILASPQCERILERPTQSPPQQVAYLTALKEGRRRHVDGSDRAFNGLKPPAGR